MLKSQFLKTTKDVLSSQNNNISQKTKVKKLKLRKIKSKESFKEDLTDFEEQRRAARESMEREREMIANSKLSDSMVGQRYHHDIHGKKSTERDVQRVEKFAFNVSMAINQQLEESSRVQSEVREAFRLQSLDDQLRSYRKQKKRSTKGDKFTTPISKEGKSTTKP